MTKLAPYAKAALGAALAGLGSVGTALADREGISSSEWVAIAVATLGTLYGVFQIPNAVAARRPYEDGNAAERGAVDLTLVLVLVILVILVLVLIGAIR